MGSSDEEKEDSSDKENEETTRAVTYLGGLNELAVEFELQDKVELDEELVELKGEIYARYHGFQ